MVDSEIVSLTPTALFASGTVVKLFQLLPADARGGGPILARIAPAMAQVAEAWSLSAVTLHCLGRLAVSPQNDALAISCRSNHVAQVESGQYPLPSLGQGGQVDADAAASQLAPGRVSRRRGAACERHALPTHDHIRPGIAKRR